MVSESTNTRKQDHKEKDYSFTCESWPLLPEGIYQAQCVHYEIGRSHPHSQKLFLHFQITEGQYLGERLFMAINLTDNKGRIKRKFGQSSRFYEAWVIANDNQHPPRNDRMSPSKFKNGIFEVKVRTTKPKYTDGRNKPECFHYSVVDYLIKRLA